MSTEPRTDSLESQPQKSKLSMFKERRLWRFFIKPLLNLISTLLVCLMFSFFLFNIMSAKILQEESERLQRLMVKFQKVNQAIDQQEDDAYNKLSEFQEYFYFSPESDMAVGWIMLDALTSKAYSDKASEPIVRKALNRLQGWELKLYLRTLDNRVSGYRHSDFKIENDESFYSLPDAAQKSILRTQDIYQFSESEVSALKECESNLNAQGDHYEWLSAYYLILEMIYPGFVLDDCSLTGKIKI